MMLLPLSFCRRRFIFWTAFLSCITLNIVSCAFSQIPSAGDKVRMSSGIRPSLHPLTINVISELLRHRSLNYFSSTNSKGNDNEMQIQPLIIDEIIADALDKRSRACRADNSVSSDMFNKEECDVIRARVFGVLSTLDTLENALVTKVSGVPWVAKYGEYGTFGLLPNECCNPKNSTGTQHDLMRSVLDDPLLRMTRAECLLALFLTEITLGIQEERETIDFLDDERRDVLL